jgi:hypothetical protein
MQPAPRLCRERLRHVNWLSCLIAWNLETGLAVHPAAIARSAPSVDTKTPAIQSAGWMKQSGEHRKSFLSRRLRTWNTPRFHVETIEDNTTFHSHWSKTHTLSLRDEPNRRLSPTVVSSPQTTSLQLGQYLGHIRINGPFTLVLEVLQGPGHVL